MRPIWPVLVALAALTAAAPGSAHAQGVPETEPAAVALEGAPEQALDSLVARALAVSPMIRAAERRVDAARAAIGPAGALEDPMLMLGVMNQPLGGDMPEEMAMRAVGVSQMIPYPGKLARQRRAAEQELAAAEIELEGARRAVTVEVQEAYFELALLDRSLAVLERNEAVLRDFLRLTETRYAVGTGEQPDVLKARVELARLAEEVAMHHEKSRATLATLNAALDRPTDVPVAAVFPESILRMAVPEGPDAMRFTSAALGARVADSPVPPLDELQALALRENPELRAADARIRAQAARVELARKAYLPDVDVSLQYGQRDGLADLVSAVVSVPLPVHKRGRQDLEVAEAEAELGTMEAERQAKANAVRADVARAHAELEGARSQLALFVKSILPQGRAALESAMSSFQVGRVDFLAVLESQATLYSYETAYYRALADFATRLARIERLVGKELAR